MTKKTKRVAGWARLDSNQLPPASEAGTLSRCALRALGYDPKQVTEALRRNRQLAVDLATDAVTLAGARRALRVITADLIASRAA